MERRKYKVAFLLLLAPTLFMLGCSRQWVENKNELLSEFINLFNPTGMPDRKLPDSVIVEIDGRTALFDKTNVEVLAAIMRRELVSGSDDEVKGHSTDRIQVGGITVGNSKATTKIDLFRSKSLPRLFSVETPFPDDFSTGILFMMDANDDLVRMVK